MHAFSIKTLSMFGRLSVDGRSKCIRNEVFYSRRDCDNRRLPYSINGLTGHIVASVGYVAKRIFAILVWLSGSLLLLVSLLV